VRRYFGTDGVRGVVGEELTPDFVERLGTAFALWSGGATTLVARDTRPSGPELERRLATGLASGGADVLVAGVLPTPAVALLADAAGAVVSASHNPSEYNGVKFFGRSGKLTDDEEETIERLLDVPSTAARGHVSRADGLEDTYVDVVCERFGRPLDGLRVVLDCANGAMYRVAPEAFRRVGADVTAVAAAPDEGAINDRCGATDLSLLSGAVRAVGADLGVAFDGDGDRMLAVDAQGREVDGDQIVAILALHLGVDLVCVTEMTNAGFHVLMAERGVRVITTDVGDRYVLDALRREGGILGGEQSGHVIVLDGHTSGDGLAAALLLCGAVVAGDRSLARAAAEMPRFPQAKANVRVRTKELPPSLLARIEEANTSLAGTGRVLVRPSGTEPVVRILAEAERAEEAERLCGTLAAYVEQELGWPSKGSPGSFSLP
jgi:phosphoglucosamine mutase